MFGPNYDNITTPHQLMQAWEQLSEMKSKGVHANLIALIEKTNIVLEKNLEREENDLDVRANLPKINDSIQKIVKKSLQVFNKIKLSDKEKASICSLEQNIGTISTMMAKSSLNRNQENFWIKRYSSEADPAFLQREGHQALKELHKHQNPEKRAFYLHWAEKFFSKAFDIYIEKKQMDNAKEVRTFMTTYFRELGEHVVPFYRDIAERSPALMDHAMLGPINLGFGCSEVDGPMVKRGGIVIRDITLDGQNRRLIEFKVTDLYAERIRQRLLLLKNDDLKQELGVEAEVDEGQDYLYYKQMVAAAYVGADYRSGEYTALREQNQAGQDVKARKMGTSLIVTLPGLGRVEIGDDPTMPAMQNKIRILVDFQIHEDDLHKLFSVCGLNFLLTDGMQVDQERLKFNMMLHNLHPREVYNFESNSGFYEAPVEELLTQLEAAGLADIRQEWEHWKVNMEPYTILPGKNGFKFKGLGQDVVRLGARGFMAGVGGPVSIVSKVVASIIQSGAFSSQTRHEHGLTVGGDSVEDDHRSNGSDSIFTRVVTQNAIDGKSRFDTIPLSGFYQIIYHTDLAQQQSYCHNEDKYGVRARKGDPRARDYATRPNLKELVRTNERSWNCQNEVMFKDRVDSAYIKKIVYRDPRRVLLKELETIHFFDNKPALGTDKDKLDYISANIPEVSAAMGVRKDEKLTGRVFNIEGRFQYSIEEHWAVDPKQVLMEQLNLLGIKQIGGAPVEEVIIEADKLEERLFADCYDRSDVI